MFISGLWWYLYSYWSTYSILCFTSFPRANLPLTLILCLEYMGRVVNFHKLTVHRTFCTGWHIPLILKLLLWPTAPLRNITMSWRFSKNERHLHREHHQVLSKNRNIPAYLCSGYCWHGNASSKIVMLHNLGCMYFESRLILLSEHGDNTWRD